MGFTGDFELWIKEEKIENKDKWGRIQNQLKKKSYMLRLFKIPRNTTIHLTGILKNRLLWFFKYLAFGLI